MKVITLSNRAFFVALTGALTSILLVGVGSYFAGASTPDASGKINACYRNNGGDLRIIDTANASDTCSNKETPISWDQKPPFPSAKGQVDENGTLVTASLKGVTSWTQGTDQAFNDNGFRGYCLEVPFTPNIGLYQRTDTSGGVGGGYVVTKGSFPGIPAPYFDQSSSQKYCQDAKYNVYVFGRDGHDLGADVFDKFTFVIY